MPVKVVVDSMMWKWVTIGLSSCSRMRRRSSSVEKMVYGGGFRGLRQRAVIEGQRLLLVDA